MPLPRLRSYDDQLADYLRGRLDILLDSTGLDARNVADIAVVAAAACEEFTAATHLLDLLAAIPPPTGNPDFWQALGKASDTPTSSPPTSAPGSCARWKAIRPASPTRSCPPSARSPRPTGRLPPRWSAGPWPTPPIWPGSTTPTSAPCG